MASDGLHLHVITDDHALEAQSLPEYAGLHRPRKGGRVGWIEVTIDHVGAHDGIASPRRDQLLERDEFALMPRGGDVHEAEMGVAGGAAVSGEMFRASQYPVGAVGFNEFSRVAGDDRWIA